MVYLCAKNLTLLIKRLQNDNIFGLNDKGDQIIGTIGSKFNKVIGNSYDRK